MRAVLLKVCAASGLLACGSAVGDPLSTDEALALPQPPPDRTIAYGEHARQFGELRLPEGAEGPYPVAIVIHGGCWLAAFDQGYVSGLAEALTRHGLATWSIAYRRVGEPGGGWPGTFVDVARAADHVRQLAERFPLDTERIVAVGHSAGGHLALWLAGRSKLGRDSPLHEPDPLPVDGVLALAAAADVALLAKRDDCGNAAERLMGGLPKQRPARYAAGSPVELAPLGVPQILVNGALDEQWSAPANSYFKTAKAAGDPVRRRIADQAGHFELVVPSSRAWATVERALNDLLRRAD